MLSELEKLFMCSHSAIVVLHSRLPVGALQSISFLLWQIKKDWENIHLRTLFSWFIRLSFVLSGLGIAKNQKEGANEEIEPGISCQPASHGF